jgi:hypothetical protein
MYCCELKESKETTTQLDSHSKLTTHDIDFQIVWVPKFKNILGGYEAGMVIDKYFLYESRRFGVVLLHSDGSLVMEILFDE